jgi:putative hydrolase of the HAD superfamily
LDLSKYFDVIVVSGDEDVGVRKPEPKLFQIMSEKMGLQPDSLFMVGDVLEKEILPALELGWGGLWIKPNVQISESNAHISWQDLLANSRSIPTYPLSISWAQIYM